MMHNGRQKDKAAIQARKRLAKELKRAVCYVCKATVPRKNLIVTSDGRIACCRHLNGG